MTTNVVFAAGTIECSNPAGGTVLGAWNQSFVGVGRLSSVDGAVCALGPIDPSVPLVWAGSFHMSSSAQSSISLLSNVVVVDNATNLLFADTGGAINNMIDMPQGGVTIVRTYTYSFSFSSRCCSDV